VEHFEQSGDAMKKTESQRLHELMIPVVDDAETVRAEGRFHPDHTGNRSYIIITDRRILWRHVGAVWSETDFPLHQLEFQDVNEVRETSTGNRSFFEIRLGQPQARVFGFSRPDAAAAVALRERVLELGIPYVTSIAPAPEMDRAARSELRAQSAVRGATVKTSLRSRWNGEKILLQYERLPSFWERASARLIDQTLTAAAGGGFLVPGFLLESVPLIVVGFLVYFPGNLVYEVACTARWGQTLGKRIKGLRVVKVSDGQPPGVMQSLLRWLVLHTAFWADWSVWLNRNHRGPHDRLSHTVVVYADSAPPLV
jgi:uncharacterized RDD family membrane protein YckC